MSDTEYTPETAYVRDAFISERLRDRGIPIPDMGEYSKHIAEEQDNWHRWLDAHDAKVAALATRGGGDQMSKRDDINEAVASELGITPEESDMIGRVVAESLRRSDGEPSMTDEEYSALVSDWMDRFPEAPVSSPVDPTKEDN